MLASSGDVRVLSRLYLLPGTPHLGRDSPSLRDRDFAPFISHKAVCVQFADKAYATRHASYISCSVASILQSTDVSCQTRFMAQASLRNVRESGPGRS